MRSRFRRTAPSALFVLLACRTRPVPTAPELSPSELLQPATELLVGDRTTPQATPATEWVRLTSNEWLKCEILSFDGDTLEVDSDVLGTLLLDWEDVAEILSERPFMLLLDDHESVFGILRMVDDEITVTGDAGPYRFSRRALVRLVPGRPREANYWSGEVRLNGMVSSGNTEQANSTLYAGVSRETAASRLDLSLDSVLGSRDGDQNANNHTLRGRSDLFLSQRLYVTPLGFEVFRDTFQNIDVRAAPYSGLGYKLHDKTDFEWDVNTGVGYRYTRFLSVAAGEERSDGTAVFVLGTVLSKDLTARIDLDLEYGTQIGLEDLDDTNHDASLVLSSDFLLDLDLDVRVVWKRVGRPETDDNGITPEKNDLRIEVGLIWEW